MTLALSACSEKAETAAENQAPATKTSVPVKPAPAVNTQTATSNSKMKWYTIEEVQALNEKSPKPLLVDVYTDWCGWCKVMDKKTFSDAAIQEYIQENFYPVKFNAEQKSAIEFGGKTYNFVPGGRRGHNELASYLLKGRLGYPSFAFLNSDYNHLHITVGFKNPEQFMAEMKNVMAGAMKG